MPSRVRAISCAFERTQPDFRGAIRPTTFDELAQAHGKLSIAGELVNRPRQVSQVARATVSITTDDPFVVRQRRRDRPRRERDARRSIGLARSAGRSSNFARASSDRTPSAIVRKISSAT